MKKYIVLFILLSLFCAAGMLSGCDFHEHPLSTRLSYNEDYHYYEATCEHKGVKRGISHHEMGEWITLKKPTCQQEGRKKASCVCGYEIEEQLPIDENNHVYAKVFSYDETGHYRAAVCEHSNLRIEEEEHTLAYWTTLRTATCMDERIESGRCKCGYEKLYYSPIDENVHVYATEWSYNELYHFYPAICSHTRFCKSESSHFFSDWEMVKAPTCMEEGEERRSCFCGYYETRTIEISSEHLFSSEWTYNEKIHYQAALCEHAVRRKEDAHAFSNWETTHIPDVGVSGRKERSCFCGYVEEEILPAVTGSVGLEYRLDSDGKYAVVGLGTCTDTAIEIPYYHQGKFVEKIEGKGFKGSQITSIIIPNTITEMSSFLFEDCTSLTSATVLASINTLPTGTFSGCSSLKTAILPDGMQTIGSHAFSGCSQLTFVRLPNTITEIYASAFYNCKNLSITIPNGLTRIESYAFYNCKSLRGEFPKTLIEVGVYAFFDCQSITAGFLPAFGSGIIQGALYNNTSLKSVILQEGITEMKDYSFWGCESLQWIVIPKTLMEIGKSVFSYCDRLTTVYYGGTEKDWQILANNIGEYNTELTSATRYYYSDTRPLAEGNFWHYDAEGNPVVWE